MYDILYTYLYTYSIMQIFLLIDKSSDIKLF